MKETSSLFQRLFEFLRGALPNQPIGRLRTIAEVYKSAKEEEISRVLHRMINEEVDEAAAAGTSHPPEGVLTESADQVKAILTCGIIHSIGRGKILYVLDLRVQGGNSIDFAKSGANSLATFGSPQYCTYDLLNSTLGPKLGPIF